MSTPPLPPNARRSAPIQRPSLLARWKAAEPLRLYGYAVLSAVLLALGAAGLVTDSLAESLVGVVAAVLAVVPTVEAGRASVYSTRGMVTKLLEVKVAQEAAQAHATMDRPAGW